MGFVPLTGATGSDQESSPQPSYAHTNSSFGPPPRRILTPKSPRRSSLGRPVAMGAPGSQHPLFPRNAETPPVPPIPPTMLHQSMSAPNVALGSGPGQGSGPGSGSGQIPGSVPGSYFPPHAAGQPPSMMPRDSPQRSFSQPYYSRDAGGHGDNHGSHSHTPEVQPTASTAHDTHHHHHHQQQQPPQQQDQQPPRFPFPPGHRPQGDYSSNTPNRIVSASSTSTGGGEGPWGPQGPAGGPGGGRSMSMSEGQQFITITPSFGEEIHVPVDVHQASKQADEKRLRNAGASARFRARKKEKDREAQLGIQRLESMNRELQKRNQELEAQREFYRNERNRLRHIMSQTPNMRDYAESGPPSPVSAYSSLPYAPEGSSMSQGNTPHPQQQQQAQIQPQQQQPLHARPHIHQQQPPQHQHQQPQRPYPHQHTPTHTQPPMYPPMSTAPDYPGPPPGHPSAAPESSSSGLERPAQRRRTDSGPNMEYYTPSYTTSAPPPPILSTTLPSALSSSLPPPLPPTGPPSRFHSMSPSPLSGSPSNPRLPPLRLDTPGSNAGSVGVGGGLATGPPTPEAGHSVSALPVPHYPPGTTAPSAYSRSYDTAGWAADAPSPHTQHPPPDPKYHR
ncbi:hypothetical protein SEUCBS139899_008339 [Sporothrix eucalyptigena]|uniref:BZIP domain-containing protein n=1 Tax=Sporothrix eucalyptigena TaxID=1812306 RepID=A0ABP0CYQ3_9PEZI